ncbi:hypothetical protein A9Q89_10645 [Gammaproteobacteria bacterium 53_120_T64]|nr:hypothetical protein A9Q89_10645 [Gammaproteobacteria bacterium 53_120_T64]
MSNNKETRLSNWYQDIEAKRAFIIGTVLLLCFVIVAATSLRHPTDYDGYWHLQMGKDWVENGLSPYQDHYSFTYKGEAISSPPVLFQAALYTLVKWFGEFSGLITFKLLASLLTLGCMWGWLKQIKAPALVYCLIFPMLTVLIQLRAQVRPELISYALSIIALILYQRAHLKLSIRAIAPIALLLLFWANYHTPILGYVIFFGLFVDIGLKLIKEKASIKTWLVWASWGVLLIAIGFLTPSMAHPVYGILILSDAWKTITDEFQSPMVYNGIASVYVLVLIAMTTLVMALRQGKFGYLVCSGVMLYAGLTMARMVTPAGIIFLGMFAHLIRETKIQGTLQSSQYRPSSVILLLSLTIFLIPMLESIRLVRSMLHENQTITNLFPEHLVTYMLDNNKSGRIFNEVDMGGFLIYRLSPNNQVYIDTRTNILYPLEHVRTWVRAKTDSESLKTELQKYKIDLAIMDSTVRDAQLMLIADELKLDFVDERYALYSRKSPNFPATGQLWAKPYCWEADQSPRLSQEWQIAQAILPQSSPVMQLLELTTWYATADDPKDWLSKFGGGVPLTDASMRFVGYQALNNGFYKLAAALFSSIYNAERKDYLAFALALLRNEQTGEAEVALDRATKLPEHRYDTTDYIIMQGLLSEIKTRRPLQHIDQGLVKHIAETVDSYALSNYNELVSVRTFCRQ